MHTQGLGICSTQTLNIVVQNSTKSIEVTKHAMRVSVDVECVTLAFYDLSLVTNGKYKNDIFYKIKCAPMASYA